ncbi:MAG: translocation/assembly module TamB domain-containing protein, partial [candidate division Zixibacteria bacterium]
MKKALRIPVYIFAVLALLVFTIIYLFMFTTLPERELNSWISYKAERASGYNFSFERMNRDFWNHLVLDGVRIAPVEVDNGPSIAINKVELKYDISGLTKGNYLFDIIEADSIRIILPPVSGGSEDKPSSSPVMSVAVSAEKILINSLDIRLANGEDILVDSVYLTATTGDDGIDIECRNLVARWPARDIEVKRLIGKISSLEDGFRLESLHLVTGRSNLFIAGTVGSSFTTGLDLSIGVEPIDLDDIRNLTGVKINGRLDGVIGIRGNIADFGGDVSVDGTFMKRPFEEMSFSYQYENKNLTFESIDGKVFHAGFKGSGKIDFGVRPEQYVYAGYVEHLDLREVAPDLLTDFTGAVELTGQSFGADHFHMRAKCDFDSVRVESYFFHEAIGTVEFDLKRISFLPDFNARYKNTYLDVTGSLEYKGEIDLNGTARFEDLTDFTDQIFLRKLGGRGNAAFDLSGPTRDFSADAYFDSDSCWTYGLETEAIHIDASLKSFISHRVGLVSGSWSGGELYSVPTDSGFFETSVSGEMVFLDSVRIFGLDGGLRFNGTYDGTQVPPEFTADTLFGEIFGNRFSSKEPIRAKVYEREAAIESLTLGYKSGVLDLKGIVTYDLDMNLDFTVRDFQIKPILKQIYPKKEVRGTWSGSAVITGNFDDPEIEFSFDLDSLTVDNIHLGTLVSRAEYEGGYLYTDSTELSSEYGTYKFSGRLPMDLSFAEVENRLPDEPIDLKLKTTGKRLQLAEIFIDAVERYNTDFEFELGLTGTYSEPSLFGSGKLTDGELKSQYMVNPITGIYGEVRMENEMVYIDSVSASVAPLKQYRGKSFWGLFTDSNGKEKPVITASGTITLMGLNNFLYDLTVKGSNVEFWADAYDVTGIAGFDLKVEGETPPTVRGGITLSRLDIKDEFENFVGLDYDPSIAAVEDSTMWDLDLNVTALNNIWIKNLDVDGEFKADIRVQRHVGIIGALGTLEAIRGTYNVIGEKPRFQTGTITYPDFATVDPEIDFIVVKRIRPLQADGGETSSEPFDMEL